MSRFYALLLTAGVLFTLSGCFIQVGGDEPMLPKYRPLLMSRTSLEQSVALVAPREMHNTGKIFLKGRYVYINERYEGVHIIDNANPSQPRNVGFLRIPGNIDISMRGNLLYADNAVDLVTLDMAGGTAAQPSIQVTSRVRNAFPELAPPEPASVVTEYRPENRPPDAVVVGWQKVQ